MQIWDVLTRMLYLYAKTHIGGLTLRQIGRNIKALRDQHGLTQEQFGEDLGYHKSYICDLEHGTRSLSAAMMEKIAVVFSVSTAVIVAGMTDDEIADMDDHTGVWSRALVGRLAVALDCQMSEIEDRVMGLIERAITTAT